jgi:Spy/CpxP family protein refolding chaperone
MRKLVWMFAVVFVLSAVSSTFAQPGGRGGMRGGFGMMGGGFGLFLENDQLKKEVNLTEDQVTQLRKVLEESRPPRPERREGGQGREQRPAPPSPEEFEKRIDETQAKLDKILTPEQREKVKVLQFQLSGGLDSPFLGTRSLTVLNLTEEQKMSLKKIEAERNAEMRKAFENIDFRNMSQEDRDKMRAEGEARNKKVGDQIKGILTPEQKEKGEKLTAEGKDLREKLGLPELGARGQRGPRGDRGGEGGGGEYRPGRDSWQPGQGGGRPSRDDGGQAPPKRSFPRSE